MSERKRAGKTTAGREPITVTLPVSLREQLADFCRERRVPPDIVVERALLEYFREGDMSH